MILRALLFSLAKELLRALLSQYRKSEYSIRLLKGRLEKEMRCRKVRKKEDATSVVRGAIIRGQKGKSRTVSSRTSRFASL